MPVTACPVWKQRGMRPNWRRCAPPWRRPWGCALREPRVPASSAPPWCKPSSTASSPPGCCGRVPRPFPRLPMGRCWPSGPARSVSGGGKRCGICARRCWRPSSNNWPNPAACNPWAWWRCWTGPPPPWRGWTVPPSSPASTAARRCPISMNPSWRPLTRPCGKSWVCGTPRRRWCGPWWPVWTTP